jgi:hypothetical protein
VFSPRRRCLASTTFTERRFQLMAKKGWKAPVYRTYSFVDKDPMIDKIRTVVGDSGLKYSQIHAVSDVTSQTLRNWFHGDTKRPQFATLNAVAISLGHELQLVPGRGHNTTAASARPRVRRRSR